MPVNMRQLRGRIRSVENTRQITKAMKMVAASKLRRAQEGALRARGYADDTREILQRILAGGDQIQHPLLVARPVKRWAYCVITSDRGLAGGYTSGLLRYVETQVSTTSEPVWFVIGRKGIETMTQKRYLLHQQFSHLPDSPSFAQIAPFVEALLQGYIDGAYDGCSLVYNRFVSPMVQQPVSQPMLPLRGLGGLAAPADAGIPVAKADENPLYEYEPSRAEVVADLLRRYAESQLYCALVEAKASEFAARMHAMSQATDNATEMISSLTLRLNRARQAAITQEIAEIVGGAAAL